MIICISSWEKYNPRKRGDTKSSSWFRCQNSFVTDPDFFDYSNDQKMIWIYLLAEASAKMSAEIKINPSLVASVLRIDTPLVIETIEAFQNSGFLTFSADPRRTSSEHAADPQRTRGATYERTNERTNNKRAKALSGQNPFEPKWEPCDLHLATRWLEHAKSITPHIKADLHKWADAVRLIREQDKLTLDEVTKLFEWVKDDEFWSRNALSPQAVRGRSKNGLKKIENILARMQENQKAESDDEWVARKERELAEGKIK